MPKKIVPALMERRVRCILFDLGETLWTHKNDATLQSLDNAAYERMLTVLKAYTPPLSFPAPATPALCRQVNEALIEYILNARRKHPYYEPDFTLATTHALLQAGISGVTPEVSVNVFAALRIRTTESRTPFPDTFSTLEELRKRGFLLGIVSNRSWGGKLFEEDLQEMDLFEYFDPRHIAISADLGIRKPNPDIFLRTLNALHVAPREAAMVGDSLRADMAGAKKLAMFTVWKPKRYLRAELALAAGTLAEDALVSATEDDRILAYARQTETVKYGVSQDDIQPHVVIEHLNELLDVFVEAGSQ